MNGGERRLVSETGLHCDALASLGAAARQNGLAAGGLHPRAESVGLAAAPAVGLECTFWHCGRALLLKNDGCWQTLIINEFGGDGQFMPGFNRKGR